MSRRSRRSDRCDAGNLRSTEPDPYPDIVVPALETSKHSGHWMTAMSAEYGISIMQREALTSCERGGWWWHVRTAREDGSTLAVTIAQTTQDAFNLTTSASTKLRCGTYAAEASLGPSALCPATPWPPSRPLPQPGILRSIFLQPSHPSMEEASSRHRKAKASVLPN